MLIANGKNMQNDILISLGVLIGLGSTFILGLPILDSVTALIVSFWIMRTGWGIFMETYTELMDGTREPGIYTAVFEAVESVKGAANPHRTRIRKLANMYIIDMDIEVDGAISVKEGHKLASKVEEKVKASLENVYDIIVHIEPLGNIEKNERFGLSSDKHDRGEI